MKTKEAMLDSLYQYVVKKDKLACLVHVHHLMNLYNVSVEELRKYFESRGYKF